MSKFHFVWLCLCVCLSTPAHAFKQVLSFTEAVQPNAVLSVEGVNDSTVPVMLIIRIDDTLFPEYAQRVNIERMVAPGAFDIQLTLANTLKSNKTPLDLSSLRQVIVFSNDDTDKLVLKRLAIDIPAQPITDVIAWDFGAQFSPVWPGFTRITPDSQVLDGQQLTALQRDRHFSITEGLITDGIKGIHRLTLPPTNTRSTVTLFIDDMGDWEYTPRILSRIIKVNGKPVFAQQLTHQQWLEQHYLKGLDEVVDAQTSVYHSLIESHYSPITFELPVSASEHVVTFHGDMPEAGFVSAIMVEPNNDTRFSNALAQARQQWWEKNWPTDPTPQGLQRVNKALGMTSQTVTLDMAQHSNEFSIYRLYTTAGKRVSDIHITHTHHLSGLDVELRQSRWQLRRQGLKSNALQPSAQYLTQPYATVPSAQYPTLLALRVKTHSIPPGQYPITLHYQVGDKAVSHVVVVNVLDTTLPLLTKSIGVYSEQAVHHLWESKARANQSVQCDLTFFKTLGMNSVAPGFTTPHDAASQKVFLQELKQIQQAGLEGPILAYAPFKRLAAQVGIKEAVSRLSALSVQIAKLGLPQVLWSVADEPSNADSQALSSLLSDSSISTAGHFNHPNDHTLIDDVTVALVNEGVFDSYQALFELTSHTSQVWLYNMSDTRFSAGYLSWYYPVKGYLQWHARMPTALPFSPLDGREDDVQFLYPQSQTCPNLYAIDEALFIFAQGIDDHRWLLWLDKQTSTNPEAAKLKREIVAAIRTHQHTNTLFPAQSWTNKIKTLAKYLTQGVS